MEVKGYDGTIKVSHDKIIIKRTGVFSSIMHGLKGNKEIYINKISSIEIKNSNWITNGYIQFSFIGGLESNGGLFKLTSDDNRVIFTSKQEIDFLKLKNFIEMKIQEQNNSNNDNELKLAQRMKSQEQNNLNNDYELRLAQRMKMHITEGKGILEAEALAKMELTLEKENKKVIKTTPQETTELKNEKNISKKDKLVNESELIICEETLGDLKLLDEYSNLSNSKKDELKKEFEEKETWRLLKMACTQSKLEYLRRYYESYN